MGMYVLLNAQLKNFSKIISVQFANHHVEYALILQQLVLHVTPIQPYRYGMISNVYLLHNVLLVII